MAEVGGIGIGGQDRWLYLASCLSWRVSMSRAYSFVKQIRPISSFRFLGNFNSGAVATCPCSGLHAGCTLSALRWGQL
eukprot:16144-Eustigmatos_ZCMA.PRE.1